MAAKLYVETSVISYLTARPSRDVISQAHQELTREWWGRAQTEFELYTSRLVVAEAQLGDAAAAAARLLVLEPITLLAETPESRLLAQKLLAAGGLPQKAASDALHIAVATVHGMDYLVTWNCKHIANARMMRSWQIRAVLRVMNRQSSVRRRNWQKIERIRSCGKIRS